MQDNLDSAENHLQIRFIRLFDLDHKRLQDHSYVEGFSRQNLVLIEQSIEKAISTIAARLGGVYVPPTTEQVTEKLAQTLAVSPFVFPVIDEKRGSIWAIGGLDSAMENCAAFNNSGLHGVIIFPTNALRTKEAEKTEPHIRLYRGATIKAGEIQTAPLARIGGLSIQDVEAYRSGNTTLEEILFRVADPKERDYLAFSLKELRKSMERHGTTEMEELQFLHTCFTSGATGLDLLIAAAYKPTETYRRSSVGNVYGDFFDIQKCTIEGVMILDVPESEVTRYPSEAGIFAQIKPEWIRAIVPQHTANLTKNIERAEQLLSANTGDTIE